MPLLTARRVADACGGALVGDDDATASSIVADSREVASGAAFAAISGGKAFIADAVRDGAPFVITDARSSVPAGVSAVVVEDVVRALGTLATEVRAELAVRVVAITGSTGKTLTKDFTGAVLGRRYVVHAARASYNNEIGVPLVVLSSPDDAEVIVAELAARRPGEIAELSAMVKPDIGAITGIGETHLEIFGSRDAIARTKAELLESLPADGVAVVPSDDDYLGMFASVTQARIATVGPGGAVRYAATAIDPDGRTRGIVSMGGIDVGISLPVAGRPLLRNAAIALLIGSLHGIDPAEGAAAIADAPTSWWRMQISSVGPWTIVNDAWNANPTSSAAALRSVREIAQDRESWAVLGPMAELGPIATVAHEAVGRLAGALGYAGVVVVGEDARSIGVGAGAIAHHVSSSDEAAEFVCARVPGGALVLVKASHAVGLETFPDELRSRLRRSRQEV